MSELVSKRWAQALMELAQENEEISKEDILRDLRSVEENISASQELRDVINNPSVSTEEKQIIVCKLFQNRLIPIVYNFLFTLNLRKRLNLIPDIANEFEKELERLNNIVRISITSAIDINEDKKNDIRNRVAEKLSKDVRVEWGVNPEIIAGLIFNINETVVDNSIKHKLDKLSEEIIKA